MTDDLLILLAEIIAELAPDRAAEIRQRIASLTACRDEEYAAARREAESYG